MKNASFPVILIILIMFGCNPVSEKKYSIKSPTGKTELAFVLTETGKPAYLLSFNGKKVIDTSFLGFEFQETGFLQEGLQIVDTNTSTFSQTWEMPWGEQREVKNHYNEFSVKLKETKAPNRVFSIVFKVYDDGLGFRYEFPEQAAMNEVVIKEELTQFKLTGDHTSWWIPGDWEIYEHLYTKSKISEIDAGSKRNDKYLAQSYIPDPDAVNTPFTMKVDDNCYMSIHEANLTNYASMTLHADKKTLTLSSALVAWEDGSKVKTKTPFVTPWRTIQLAETPGGLIESNLIVNLNDPNKLEGADWIKPAKYVGIWWEMHVGKSSWGFAGGKHGATTANAKKYIDFAAANNLNAVLVEGWNTGWENWVGDDRSGIFDWVTPYPDFNIDEVVAYAKSKGIFIIGHNETSSDVEGYNKQLDTAMKFYQSKGIPVVKTGYVGTIIPKGYYHHGQWMVEHFQRVVETAAKYHISVVAHETVKATGIRRTWPNFLSREVFRGQEFDAWSNGNPPQHLEILPFTVMLGGPMDYTPGVFNVELKKLTGKGDSPKDGVFTYQSKESYKPENRVSTTLCKQLALYVVLNSPVQMAADLPENYLGHPAFQFIRDVPVTWEETKVLNGEIGEYLTVVRKDRNSDNWFLGSITNEKPRSLNIPLDFLDEGKTYSATIYSDADDADWKTNPVAFTIEQTEFRKGDVYNIILAPGGGQAISFFAN